MNKLARLLVAAGESSPDMRYAAGFSTPDDFIWFDTGEERAVVMSPLEYNRAVTSVRRGTRVFAESELGGPGRLRVLKTICERYQLDGFETPENFPLGLADALRNAGLTVTACAGEFFPEREFKSESEVAAITKALRSAETGARRAVDVLRESGIDAERNLVWHGSPLTSEVLRAEIDCAMLRCGALPTGTICAGGIQASQPHHTGSGVLRADAPIVMDIFPRSAVTGYWGDLTRTVIRGRPTPVMLRAYDAVLEARELGKRLIVRGAIPAEIHLAAAELLKRRGFSTGRGPEGEYGFFHGLGHGVGLDIHEAPRLSPRSSEPLRGGEIITVEPGLYYPEWGGIRLEDLVYLPKEGMHRTLTELEDFFVIDGND